jgi:hypothetical protein
VRFARRLSRSATASFAAALLAIGACDNGGGPASVGGGAPITVALSTDSLDAEQGASATATVALTRNNYGGPVTLSLEGAPAGVTASFDPATLTGDASSSTLTLIVDPSVAEDSYSLRVRASGEGTEDQTADFVVRVIPAESPTQGFVLASTTLTIEQGATGTTQLTVVRGGGFTGPVGFTTAGGVAGVTAAVSPNPVTGTTATLTVDVAASVDPGQYRLSVVGQGGGLRAQTSTLTVEVTAGGPGA